MHKTDTSPVTEKPSRLSVGGGNFRFKRNTVHNSTFQSTGNDSSIPIDSFAGKTNIAHHTSNIEDKFSRHIFKTKRDQDNDV